MMFRTSSSQKEGGERAFALLKKRLSGTAGRLEALHAVQVEVHHEPGALPRTVEVPGSATTSEADLLVLAMRLTGPEPGRLVKELGG